ncbi:MAG: divalent-cation tolerance protein CutA [Candidatus Xenobiia bacterium LiM19]
MTGYCVVYVTCSTKEEARKVAMPLVEKRLAACVNTVPLVESLYWWEGKLETAEEVLLIIKTKEKILDSLILEVKKNHSYTVPEIVALPIVEGNRDYLQWIENEVTFQQ